MASFDLNMPHTNALIRRLQDDPLLRAICGFNGHVPHRTTFNRFIQRLFHHSLLAENALNGLTKLKKLIPNLGKYVATDSTTVKTNCNPNRSRISDPEASWTAKNKARGKDGKEWSWGYKLHSIADADYGIPLGHIITTANRNDSPYLPRVMERTIQNFPWFPPKAVIADRGYDSKANHVFLLQRSIAPISNIRRPPGKDSFDDLHTLKGQPICMGGQPMDFIVANPHRGLLYRCPAEGCHLKDSFAGGVRHCDSEFWKHPNTNPRGFSWIQDTQTNGRNSTPSARPSSACSRERRRTGGWSRTASEVSA